MRYRLSERQDIALWPQCCPTPEWSSAQICENGWRFQNTLSWWFSISTWDTVSIYIFQYHCIQSRVMSVIRKTIHHDRQTMANFSCHSQYVRLCLCQSMSKSYQIIFIQLPFIIRIQNILSNMLPCYWPFGSRIGGIVPCRLPGKGLFLRWYGNDRSLAKVPPSRVCGWDEVVTPPPPFEGEPEPRPERNFFWACRPVQLDHMLD